MGGLDKARQSSDDLASSLSSAKTAAESLTKSIFDGGRSFEAMITSSKKAADAMASVVSSAKELSGSVGGLGILSEGIGTLGGVAVTAVRAMTNLGTAYVEMLGAADALSLPHRELSGSIYDVGTQFGKTFDEAKTYSEYIMSMSRTVSGAEFGYINASKLKDAMIDLAKSGIPIEKFKDTVSSTAGDMDLLTTGILHAGSLGLTTAEYFGKLNKAIMTQGLTSQQAVEQMAMFKDIAGETGLTVNTISDTLDGLAGKFSKLGLSADFGRPMLEGFTRTLSSMGLGIENATGLTTSLGDAMAGLTSNYATAFITAQRGGLDFGAGGGALGASIGLQAKMLQAQREPTGAAQADLAQELLGGMKDTIASFGGGQIVTVEMAAQDESLQTSFFTQTSMLKSMYNLDQDSATRTLDLMQQLEEATADGNDELAASLGEQLQDQIKKSDETTSLLDKQNSLTSGILAQAAIQTKQLGLLTRSLGMQAVTKVDEKMGGALSSYEAELKNVESEAAKLNKKIGAGGEMTEEDFKSLASSLSEPETTFGATEQPPGNKPKEKTLVESVDALVEQLKSIFGIPSRPRNEAPGTPRGI
jgi:hypothetical protein